MLGVASSHALAQVVAGDQAELAAHYLRVLSLWLPVAVLSGVALAATRGYGSMRPTVVGERIGLTSLQVVGVVTVMLLGGAPEQLVLGWVVPYLVPLAVSVAWLARVVGVDLRSPRSASVGRWSDRGLLARDYWAFTIPRVGVSVSQVMLRRLDIVLVSAVLSTGDAAVYTSATRLVAVCAVGVLGLQQALAPQLSRVFARADSDAAQQLFGISTAWMMVVSWPVYLSVMALAPVILPVFGDGYEAGSIVVVIASLGMLYGTSAGAVDTALLMSGHSLLSLANSLAVLAVNVGLNVWLIPQRGIVGAAMAWAGAVVVRNVLAQVQVHRLEGLAYMAMGRAPSPVSRCSSLGQCLCFWPFWRLLCGQRSSCLP